MNKTEKIISKKVGDWEYFYEDDKMMEKTHLKMAIQQNILTSFMTLMVIL